MNALEIQGLCKSYDGFTLDRLNLVLPAGYILGLIGENGAGKSTTIRLILDMIRRDSGTIRVLGQENGEENPALREQIGVVLDEVGLPDCMNAGQIGRVMRGIYRQWDEGAYRNCLDRLSIPKQQAFRSLSRGTKMKLGLAVALSHRPKLLILDEATNGLDPVVRETVLDMLREFTRDADHSILISSHIVSDLERIADYIAFLHRGRLLLCEEKDLLLERYGLLRCTKEQLAAMDPCAIVRRRLSAYGAEAVVERGKAPAGLPLGPVNLEELFVSMVREGEGL